MKFRYLVVALLGLGFLAADADARLWRRNRWRRARPSYSRVTDYGFRSATTVPNALAMEKAQFAAARNIKGHCGGGFGSAYAEGVGFSSYSAQQALNYCCFTGQRALAGSAVVRGSDGWYACKLFW